MKIILALVLFLLGGRQSVEVSHQQEVQAVLNQALNSPELWDFTSHYLGKGQVMYYRFTPSPAYDKTALLALRPLTLAIGKHAPLVYDERRNDKQTPVVIFRLLALSQDSAEVHVGLAIEGAVGKFTLVKRGTWRIVASDVYEI